MGRGVSPMGRRQRLSLTRQLISIKWGVGPMGRRQRRPRIARIRTTCAHERGG